MFDLQYGINIVRRIIFLSSIPSSDDHANSASEVRVEFLGGGGEYFKKQYFYINDSFENIEKRMMVRKPLDPPVACRRWFDGHFVVFTGLISRRIPWYILFYTVERLSITNHDRISIGVCYHNTLYTFCFNGSDEMDIARNNL